MAAYWEYLRWGLYVSAALGTWRVMPLAVVRLVAAFTRDEKRHKQCMEVLRLSRRDAATIPPYTAPSPQAAKRRTRKAVPGPGTLE
jgi:hypothetical protein